LLITKRDLSNSQNKKLRGQIEDYLDHYNYVIVCACGIDDMSGWRKLKKKYSQGNLGFNPQSVVFIHKKKDNYGKERKGRGQDRSGGLLGPSDEGRDMLGF